MKPPDDIRHPMIWYGETLPNGWTAEGRVNPDRNWPPCRVYWGSHGCERPHGHEGDHWCDCCDCKNHPDPDSGCVAGPPYYGPDTKFYGEDC